MILALVWGCTTPEPNPAPELPTCDPLELTLVQEITEDEMPAPAPDHSEAGVGLGDLDGDGDLDALIAFPSGSFALTNEAGTLTMEPAWTWDGGAWPPATGTHLADFDGDGDLDVYLGHWDATDRIGWNDGTGRFTETLLEGGSEGSASWSGSVGDVDGDGDLDLYVAARVPDIQPDRVIAGEQRGFPNYLYIQTDGAFVREDVRIPQEDNDGLTFHSALLDADDDGDLDIYDANDWGYHVTPNRLLTNDGTGRFSADHTCTCEPPMYGMGAAVGDVTNDGFADLFITDIGSPDLLHSLGDGTFADATLARGALIPPTEVNLTSWGTTFVDLDRNGCNDLVAAYGRLGREMDEYFDDIEGTGDDPTDPEYQSNVAMLSDCSSFTRATGTDFDAFPSRDRSVAVGDLDADGRADLVTVGKYFVRVWKAGGGCDQGLTVRLDAGGPNPQGVGSRVRVTAGGRTQVAWMLPSTLHSSSAYELYFGLGSELEAEVEVQWPDGSVSVEHASAGVVEIGR